MEIMSGWTCSQRSLPSCQQNVREAKGNIRDVERGWGERERPERENNGVASISPSVPQQCPVFYPS